MDAWVSSDEPDSETVAVNKGGALDAQVKPVTTASELDIKPFIQPNKGHVENKSERRHDTDAGAP